MAEFDDKLNSILSDPEAMAKIAQLAQSLSGAAGETPGTGAPSSPPPAGGPPPGQGDDRSPPPGGGSSAGGLDPDLLFRFLPLLRELNSSQDSNARQLLYALRPYLKPERQVKVERALQLARLFRIGRRFLTGREGHV